MGYILSELQPPKAITSSTKLDDCIAIVRNDIVEVVKVVNNSLSLVHQIQFDEPIVACQLIQTSHGFDLVVLAGTTISVIEKETWNTIMSTELETNGQVRSSDFKSFIVNDINETKNYFVLYHFQGKLDLFMVDDQNGKKRKYTDSSFSVTIGSIVVVSVVAMCDDYIAVLYRDFSFNYSLRYYKVNLLKKTIMIAKQFEQFDEPPSCLIPWKHGGVLVVSNLHIFYFPSVDQKLDLVGFDETISINYAEEIVTKKIDLDVNETISCYEIVDDSCILLISLIGNTYTVKFDALFTRKSVEIHSITLSKLDLSTVPVNVHLVAPDTFFATSRMSQSLIFQVMSHQPFINVLRFIESSPPVLDIDYTTKFDQMTIFSCQGGYHSGEFKKYSPSIENMHLNQTIQVSTSKGLLRMDDVTFFVQKDESNEIIVLDGDEHSSSTMNGHQEVLDVKKFENCQIVASNVGIYENNQQILQCNMEFARVISRVFTIYINTENNLVFSQRNRPIHKSHLSLKEVSCLSCLTVGETHYALICTWHGVFKLYSFTQTDTMKLHTETLKSGCAIISASMVCHNDTLFIILLTETGILQIPILLNGTVVHGAKRVTRKLSSMPLKMVSDNGLVVLYSKHEIFAMRYDPILNLLLPVNIDETKQHIDNVMLIDNKLAILLNRTVIQIMEIHFKPLGSLYKIDSIFSRSLYLKSINIPGTKFSVAISKLFKMDEVLNKISTTSQIELINNSKMKVVHSYEFEKGNNAVDLCIIPEFEDETLSPNSFVVLNSGSTTPLTVFSIQKSKLVFKGNSSIKGLSEVETFDLQSITVQDGDSFVFFISGSSNFAVELMFDKDVPKWKIKPDSTSSLLVHCISHICNKHEMIIGDLRQGLLRGTFDIEKPKLTKVPTEYPHQYLTTMDGDLDENDHFVIFSADSFGNVSALGNDFEQLLAFNIGEQVNVIKMIKNHHSALIGTVNGGIFLLKRIKEEDFTILEKCTKELGNISGKYGKDSKLWKLLIRDNDGQFTKLEDTGIIDMRLIKEYFVKKPTRKPFCKKNIALLELMIANI